VKPRRRERHLPARLWTAVLLVVVVTFVAVSLALFNESFRDTLPVTVTSDRSGLVMEDGGKVKLRGVPVGHVRAIHSGATAVTLQLDIDADQLPNIPANVGAQIRATSVFGAKYVDLIYPKNPVPQRLHAGAVLQSQNVSTEVNTVFQNLTSLLDQIDPAKLNSVLGAFAEAVRGKGRAMGQAITDANQVLAQLTSRGDITRADWQALAGFADTYSGVAANLVTILDAASTTSTAITDNAAALDALLLNTAGFGQAGIDLLGPNNPNLIRSLNDLAPTTDLLLKYNPEYTCTLIGSKWLLDNGGYDVTGGANGKSIVIDAGLLLGDDPYRYPDNLPIVAAKGGPGGKPGCGSLPIVDKNWPVRSLIANTGFGTGVDIRPNPGIAHPWWVDLLPVTRAVPQPPSIRGLGRPPAIGPVPYPGAPPYGAPQYGPDGTPLYPGVPPAPPKPAQP
jgi:phospholipid/cholesterol/gamma-HCH transport system substrate-binding protein